MFYFYSELKPIHRNKLKETKKFIKYSVYAWGCPFLISTITYFMDEIYLSSNFIRPEFGYNKCWFDSKYTIIFYSCNKLYWCNFIIFNPSAKMFT